MVPEPAESAVVEELREAVPVVDGESNIGVVAGGCLREGGLFFAAEGLVSGVCLFFFGAMFRFRVSYFVRLWKSRTCFFPSSERCGGTRSKIWCNFKFNIPGTCALCCICTQAVETSLTLTVA